MKKKIELNKKTIKRLNLKLEAKNERKVAPATLLTDGGEEYAPTWSPVCILSYPPSACDPYSY